MNYESWIARRLMFTGGGGFTRVILWMAMGAVTLSVAVMILSMALMTGFQEEITKKMFGFWGHIHISDPRSIRSYEALPFPYDSAMISSIASIERVESAPDVPRSDQPLRTKGGVQHIQSYIYLPGIIKHDDQMEGIILKGIGADFDWESFQPFADSSSAWNHLERDELIISTITANRLQLSGGDKLIVYFVRDGTQITRRFTIKGTYKTGLEENDAKFSLASIDMVRGVLQWDSTQISGLEIKVDAIEDIPLITEYIYQKELPAHLYAESIREKFPSLFEWLELQDINTIVIIVLMLVVAVINMITALLILILERTQMIGILKSVGARDRSIRRVFIWFALYITMGGILFGNVLGIGLALLQDKYQFIKLNEADYYLSYAPVRILPWHLLSINAGALVIIALCLIAPSVLVSKVNPVKTIHFS